MQSVEPLRFNGAQIYFRQTSCGKVFRMIYWDTDVRMNHTSARNMQDFFRKGSISMRLEKVQSALKQKNIKFEYTEEDGCGSLDFMFRGLKFHVWEYEDNGWGAETNIYAAGRSEDIDGDYEEKISQEILSWPDMINN